MNGVMFISDLWLRPNCRYKNRLCVSEVCAIYEEYVYNNYYCLSLRRTTERKLATRLTLKLMLSTY